MADKPVGNMKFGIGFDGLDESLNTLDKLNRAIRQTESAMKTNISTMDKGSTSMTDLAQKQRDLTTTTELQAKKVQLLEKRREEYIATYGKDSSCGDTLAAAGDHRNRVLRIDCDATGRERSLETQILAERVQIELRRPVRVSALDREVLGRINAAIPLHARDLGRTGRRSSKEFGRCTDVDSAISAILAHQPRHLKRRVLDERIVRIRQRAIVLGRRRVGNDRLGRRLSRRQVVGGDFPAQRILLHARHDHSERRRLELAVDDIERQHAVLLHPRIVHKLRVSLTAAHEAELLRERHARIARGGIALVRFETRISWQAPTALYRLA